MKKTTLNVLGFLSLLLFFTIQTTNAQDCSVPFATPFSEQFTNGTLPNCWTNTSSDPTMHANNLWKFGAYNSGGFGGGDGNGRPAGTFAWADGSQGNDATNYNDVTLTSPLINISTLTSPYLAFEFFSNNTSTTLPNNVLKVEFFNGTVWTQLFTNNTSSTIWRTGEAPITTSSGTIRIRFIVDQSVNAPGYAFYNDILLDNVRVIEAPTCPNIQGGMNATAITTTSAQLSWTSVGTSFDIEWGPNGFTQGTGTVISNVTNPYTLQNLTPATAYQYYVRRNCGAGGYSLWNGPFTFTTGCDAVPIPYFQNFESVTVPALPACTLVQNAGTGNLWNTRTVNANKVLSYAYNTTNAANSWFMTPGIQLAAGTTYTLKFKYWRNAGNYIEKLKVKFGSSQNYTTMTSADIIDLNNITTLTSTDASANFTVPTNGVYYIGFNVYSNQNQNQLYVDNIAVDAALSTASFDSEEVKIYPNPANDILNLSYTDTISNVALYNTMGQQVYTKAIHSNEASIDISGLSTGTYLVKITGENFTKMAKVIKL